ncbi:MAG TPA: hypothetical protein VIN08_12055 [Ohtaekwangia sp.]|uniref:hypothetical protein n=1 Tax=Ohtaekwangia sp. TaxID=2066019 RepID=UPI002F93A65A
MNPVLKFRVYILLALVASACAKPPELPVFDTPQPEGLNTTNIPSNFFGTYESLVDSGLLTVTNQEIILKHFWNLNVPITEVDSIDRLTLKDAVYKDRQGIMRVTVKNDSVYQRTITIDTLYYKSDWYAIKKHKGYFILNRSFFKNPERWMITTLRATSNGLLLGTIQSKKQLDSLPDYNSNEPDSITYIPPSDNELRFFLRDEKFKNESKFVRVEYGLRKKL